MATDNHTYSRGNYENLLNAYGPPPDYEGPGTKVQCFGTWLRRNDPVQFGVMYNDWLRENNQM